MEGVSCREGRLEPEGFDLLLRGFQVLELQTEQRQQDKDPRHHPQRSIEPREVHALLDPQTVRASLRKERHSKTFFTRHSSLSLWFAPWQTCLSPRMSIGSPATKLTSNWCYSSFSKVSSIFQKYSLDLLQKNTLHLNISADNVFVTEEGRLKIGGFCFVSQTKVDVLLIHHREASKTRKSCSVLTRRVPSPLTLCLLPWKC